LGGKTITLPEEKRGGGRRVPFNWIGLHLYFLTGEKGISYRGCEERKTRNTFPLQTKKKDLGEPQEERRNQFYNTRFPKEGEKGKKEGKLPSHRGTRRRKRTRPFLPQAVQQSFPRPEGKKRPNYFYPGGKERQGIKVVSPVKRGGGGKEIRKKILLGGKEKKVAENPFNN